MARKVKSQGNRYGIAEIYGRSVEHIEPEELRKLANAGAKTQMCPFRGKTCTKNGGVCSFREYGREDQLGVPSNGSLISLCPQRFRQGDLIFKWVGEELLKCTKPEVVPEVPFLMGSVGADDNDPNAVGQIDMVLVDGEKETLHWCALEIQAVYFSGPSMSSQFSILKNWQGPGLPFPDKNRRPDFRSSGPKRLMPQLQTKVPTLRRWGKKMAVVVDEPFWNSLGEMDSVADVSNCDVAWFVVGYERTPTGFELIRKEMHLTTLERAVEGLTGGVPTSLCSFEERIRNTLHKLHSSNVKPG